MTCVCQAADMEFDLVELNLCVTYRWYKPVRCHLMGNQSCSGGQQPHWLLRQLPRCSWLLGVKHYFVRYLCLCEWSPNVIVIFLHVNPMRLRIFRFLYQVCANRVKRRFHAGNFITKNVSVKKCKILCGLPCSKHLPSVGRLRSGYQIAVSDVCVIKTDCSPDFCHKSSR